jgi:hypothetical protein
MWLVGCAIHLLAYDERYSKVARVANNLNKKSIQTLK